MCDKSKEKNEQAFASYVAIDISFFMLCLMLLQITSYTTVIETWAVKQFKSKMKSFVCIQRLIFPTWYLSSSIPNVWPYLKEKLSNNCLALESPVIKMAGLEQLVT